MATTEAERAAGLKKTVISCIVQKLQRLDLNDLREILNTATKMVERRK